MSHEKPAKSDEWYTPEWLLDAFDCHFDLDPCSPGENHWVQATKVYTKNDNGLAQDWGNNLVFMNPPYGGRNEHIPWLKKFLSHGNGIGIVKSDTSTAWFHEYITKMDTLIFTKGRVSFIRPDGTEGSGPGSGSVIFGIGQEANEILEDCDIGFFMDIRHLVNGEKGKI